MPENCRECPLETDYGTCGFYSLYIEAGHDSNWEKRRDDCPLNEIPPHGRLIDADALMDALTRAKEDDPIQYEEDYLAVSDWLCVAPTVIEADYPPSTPLEQVWTELFGEGESDVRGSCSTS